MLTGSLLSLFPLLHPNFSSPMFLLSCHPSFCQCFPQMNKGPSCWSFLFFGPAWSVVLCHYLLPYWGNVSVRVCMCACSAWGQWQKNPQNKTKAKKIPQLKVKASIHEQKKCISLQLYSHGCFIILFSRLHVQLLIPFLLLQERLCMCVRVFIPSWQTHLVENLMARCWKSLFFLKAGKYIYYINKQPSSKWLSVLTRQQ